MRRILQCDAGNTAVKWRLLEGGVELTRGRFLHGDTASRDVLLDCTERLDAAWIASVARAERDRELAGLVETRWGIRPVFAATPGRGAGLVNSYAEPGRMGVDRWLAMLGARARTRQRLCVVDAGSAVTIDLVAASGHHEGGYILPGLALMERALLADTGRVRFEGDGSYALAPGRDTRSAVQHGAALALCGAVRAALDSAGENGPPPVLFFCGGDGERLAALMEIDATLCHDLLFEGLSVYAESVPQ